MTKNPRELLERLSLSAVAFAGGFVLLAVRGDWPAVVGLAVCATVYVLSDLVRWRPFIRELTELHSKLTKTANRLER